MKSDLVETAPWAQFVRLSLLVGFVLMASPVLAAKNADVDTDAEKKTVADAEPNAADAAQSDTTQTEKSKGTEPAAAKTTPNPAEPDSASLAIERLPPRAWPAPKTRGLHGGSLWLSPFHGLQWPFIPKTGIFFSGSAWIDTGYMQTNRGNRQPNTTYWIQQGRAVLRVTPTYSDGRFFVQAQAELVGNKDQTAAQPNIGDTDDLWLKVGMWRAWDVQVGRYEGWELYHLGMGMDLNTLERQGAPEGSLSSLSPPDFYGTTFGFYRPNSVGNVAVHAYPTDFLRFELLGNAGNDATTGLNTVGARPSAILDFGFLRIKGGYEHRVSTPRDSVPTTTTIVDDVTGMMRDVTTHAPGKLRNTEKGFGGTVQLIFDPYVELGVSAAQGSVRRIDAFGGLNTKGTHVVTTIGGFVNARVIEGLLVGGGLHYTTLVDEHLDSNGKYGYFAHLQGFGAVQYLLSGQLFIKAVLGYARADFEPSFENTKHSNTMTSARLRLMYLF